MRRCVCVRAPDARRTRARPATAATPGAARGVHATPPPLSLHPAAPSILYIPPLPPHHVPVHLPQVRARFFFILYDPVHLVLLFYSLCPKKVKILWENLKIT